MKEDKRLCINSSLLRHNALIKPASLCGLNWVQCQFYVAFVESMQLAWNSFLWDHTFVAAVKYFFIVEQQKLGFFNSFLSVWVWAEFLNLLANTSHIIVKLPTLHTLHFCCLLYTFDAFVVTKCHCVWAVLEQRQEQCWTMWMGVCAYAAVAAQRWSRLQLSFAHLGLNLRPLLAEWLLLPTGIFYFTFFCLLWIIIKTLALASISWVFRPSYYALHCWYMHKNLQVKWKYAITVKV